MDPHLLPDIFAFLSENRPELGRPTMIFLGGSQVADGGIHKTSDSDHDVLVIFPEISQPESFVFTSTDGKRDYDLILRDGPSLAYDILDAQQKGKGTLLHLLVHGISLYDTENRAHNFQTLMANIYTAGPHFPSVEDCDNEINSLNLNLSHTNASHPSYLANLSAICNRLAKLILRFSGEWTANGKIGGRFLMEKMPEMFVSLMDDFTTAAATGTTTVFTQYPDTILPDLFSQTQFQTWPRALPIQNYSYQDDPHDLGEATTATRINLDAFAHYIKGNNTIALTAAATWAHNRMENLGKPLTAERYLLKPHEYFFALGRAISGMADIVAGLRSDTPTDHTMVERITALFDSNAQYHEAFGNALIGKPTRLKQFFSREMSAIKPTPLPYYHRPSRADMRADPALLMPDHWVL